MKTVMWKYPLPRSAEKIAINMPELSQVKRFAMQNGIPTMWAQVAPESPLTGRQFKIAATGEMMPHGWNYIDTCEEGSLIWHLFEGPAVRTV